MKKKCFPRFFAGIAAPLFLLFPLLLSPLMAQAQQPPQPLKGAQTQTPKAETPVVPEKTENPAAASSEATKAGKSVRKSPATSPGDIYLRQTTLDDAAQLIAQIGKTSIVVTSSVADKVVSLYLRGVDVEGMVKNLCRAAGVWYRYDAKTNTYILMSAKEYQQDIAITRDDITRTYVLKHHNVVSIAHTIRALFGNRVSLSEPVEESAPVSMGGTTRTRTGSGGRSTSNPDFYGGAAASASAPASLGGTNRMGMLNSATGNDPRGMIGRVSQDALEISLSAPKGDSPEETSASMSSTQQSVERNALLSLSDQGAPIHLTYNRQHNLLLLRSSDEAALRDVDALVREMDRPPRQVLLEMQIVEVELGSDFRSVFDIGSSRKGESNGPLGIGFGGISPENGQAPYPRQALSLGNFSEEQDATAVWQILNDRLRLRLQLLENENRVNVLATPMVLSTNNQPARLFIGDEQILVTGASSNSVTGTTGATANTITVETEQRNVGQTLIILPRINDDRSVTLTIDQDNSRVNVGATMLPLALPDGTIYHFPVDTVNTANLQVTAHAQDGMTVAVGGMINQKITNGEEKVPFLGDMPLLGHLFKKSVRENSRSQIVLLITPRVMESPEESDAIAQRKRAELAELDRSDARRGSLSPGGETPRDSILEPLAAPDLGRTAAAAPATAAQPSASDDTARLADVARAASAAVRQIDPTVPPPGGLQALSVPASLRKPKSLGESLEFQPLASWQKDGIYVTALRIVNLGDSPVAIAPTQISGRWAAIVVERQQLAAAGGETSWTWAYALSRQPYEESLEQ